MKEMAWAKINLGLKVLGKREDGYHAVDMLMQTISLADVIEITPQQGFHLSVDDSTLPTDERNLAYKAALLFSEKTGKPLDIHIYIKKKIFKAAGLAGGSADAAAVLRGLNKYWQTNLSTSELETLGAKMGSDIPFCVRGGTVRATGRGEMLEDLPSLPELWLVLVKPLELDVSTAWVYQNFTKSKCQRDVNMEALTEAVKTGDLGLVLKYLGNDLESVTLPAHPILQEIKAVLSKKGAKSVLMSGSGPTIFAVTNNEEEAKELANFMQAHYPVAALAASTRRGEK